MRNKQITNKINVSQCFFRLYFLIQELLLAAKWAELNKIPFPPIDPGVVKKEGLKECYVFKHPWDPNCPIVLHFCLVNINFKREIAPGMCLCGDWHSHHCF